MAPPVRFLAPALLLCLAWRGGRGHAAHRGPSAPGGGGEAHARLTPDWDTGTPFARTSAPSTPSVAATPAAAPRERGERDLAGLVPGPVRRRSFEQCPAGAGGARDDLAAAAGPRARSGPASLAEGRRQRRRLKSAAAPQSECEEGTLIGSWGADFKYTQTCCTDTGFCGGCAVTKNGKCSQCDAGYRLRINESHGKCSMCDDVAGWEDENGKTCTDYEISGNCSNGQPPLIDDPFKGLKPSDACCICGGGQLKATPWRYKISEQALVFGANVSGMPSPQTASRYEVSSGCGLKELGLSMGAGGVLSGTLPEYEDGESSYEVDCDVVAVEDEVLGLSAVGTLKVSVQAMSYGPKVVVFRFNNGTKPMGQADWPLTVAAGLDLRQYKVACVPVVPWITVDEKTGELSYSGDGPTEGSNSLSGEDWGFSSGECALTATRSDGEEVQAVFAVVQLRVWAAMAYERGVLARVGRPIVPLQLAQKPPEGYATRRDEHTGVEYWFSVTDASEEKPVPKALRPTLLSVSCSGANHTHWSRQTGAVTIEGQTAFVIDPATGQISGTPQVDLPQQLGKSSLMLTCHIAAGGKNYESVLTTSLYVELVDDTCFYQKPISETVWAIELEAPAGKDSAGSCKTLCRKRKDCAAYWVEEATPDSKCFGLTSERAREGAGAYKPDTIAVRARCEEGKSCLEVQSETAAFLQGKFCPKGFYEEEGFAVRAVGRSENVFAKKNGTAGSDFIMFSKQATHTRFPKLNTKNSEHFVAVKYSKEAWYLNNNGDLHFFEPVETDVLVADLDLGSNKATLLEGTREVHDEVEKGYSNGDLSIKAECDNKAAFCISGTWWRSWAFYDEVTTTLYSRSGVMAAEEFWMARGACPLPGQNGTWVIRKASDEDYMNPETGISELHGDVVACVTEDIEADAFALGSWTSGVALPTETTTGTEDSEQDSFFGDGDQAISSEASGHTITASLTSRSCQQPVASTDMNFGSVTDAGSYSLHACECFGWGYKDAEPVTQESRDVVPEIVSDGSDYNSFIPQAQLLFQGPYVCEDDAVLPFGQKNEITQEDCQDECLGSEFCAFYMYVEQLRFCLLLSKCEQLGHTGLDITHQLYGVFHGESKYCRVANPEACWVSRERRALLDGGVNSFSACAFQDVISKCDTMQMSTTESHGECGRCKYALISSEAASGRRKVPLPTSFPAGGQILASCDTSDIGGRLRNNNLMQGDHAVLTCVDGVWRGADGLEGLQHLSCVSCVQVAQRSYADSSYPEIYFLSRRELQYHFGSSGRSGCLAASEATSSPLVNARKKWCMKFYGANVSAGIDCSQSWYLSQTGELLVAGLMSVCLRSTAAGGLEVTARCDVGVDYEERRSWIMNTQHRLVNLYTDACLSQSLDDGSVQLVNCSSADEDDSSDQVWFFDGGDCRYQMHVLNHEKPPVWNFKVTGDTYLGTQEQHGDLMDLAEVQQGIDHMAFGTCKISLSASLENPDEDMFEQFDLNNFTGRLADEFNHAFAFSASGGIISTCTFGGVSGVKAVAQLEEQKASKKAQLYDLENTCDPAKKASNPDPNDISSNANKLDERVLKVATEENQVLSGVWSQHDNGAEDRVWKIAFANTSDVTIDLSSDAKWSAWSNYDEDALLECEDDYVLTGINSTHDNGREDRKFQIQCRQATGHYSSMQMKSDWTAWQNEYDSEFTYRSGEEEFLIGIYSTHDNGKEDRRFKFRTVKLCKDKSSEAASLRQDIAELEAQIAAVSDEDATCATDFPLHIEDLRELAVSYSDDLLGPNAKASSVCHLMHRGHPGDAEGFALSAPQLSSMVRSEVYRAVQAESCQTAPFLYNGTDYAKAPAEAMKVGCFAMVQQGATLWGLQCQPGAVVAVDASAGSPYCRQVNAVPGDTVLGGLLPASASCELGYAVGGWYNLLGESVKAGGSGGPSEAKGFKLTCRAVPGLSRLCEFKDGHCEADEVVTGLAFEKDVKIEYRCCKAPKTVGHGFAHSTLLDMKPWEGYYCPADFDGTGRAIYEMSRSLATTTDSSWWPEVRRSTPPSAGDATFSHLAGHEPECDPGELMTAWQIHRRGSGKISVAFSCARLGFSGGSSLAGLQPAGCQELKTEYEESSDHKQTKAGQDVGLLLGHHVECPAGTALAKWRLANDTGEQLRYVFSCCAVHPRGGGEGFEYFSMPKADNASVTQLAIMSRYNVACPWGSVIRSFRMERWSTDYLRYRLRCVGVRTERQVKGESPRLAWNKYWGTWVLRQIPVVETRAGVAPVGPEEYSYLNGQEVDCSDGFAMQGFSLEKLYGYSHKSVGELQSKDFGDAGISSEQNFDGHYAMMARCRATKLGACSTQTTARDAQRHNMQCSEDEVLQAFQTHVSETSSDELRFDYVCCKVPGLEKDTCQDLDTRTTQVLADIGLTCAKGRVLQQVGLQMNGTAEIYWSYRCCPAAGVFHSDGGIRSSSARPEDETVGASPGAQRVKVRSPSSSSGQAAKMWLDDKLQPAIGNASVDVLALDGASRKYLKSCWETNTSFDGHGLLNVTSVGSAAACQSSCSETSDCEGFTYSPGTQVCSLKRSDAGRSQREGFVSGPKQCHLRSFGPGGVGDDWASAMAAHLNSLAAGSVVILSMRGTAGEELSGPAVHALQRCGARKLKVGDSSWGAGDAYALVSVVDGEALDEALSESSVTLDVDLPEPWTAAPIVEFSAAFVSGGSGGGSPFPKEKPAKPDLLSFSATKPDYDKFCDVATRQNLGGCEDGQECPEEEHPCYHTYAKKITESAWWSCEQRSNSREYLYNVAKQQQMRFDAEMAKMERIFGYVEMGLKIGAAAIAAVPYGSYAVAAKEGAEEASDAAKETAELTTKELLKAGFIGGMTEALKQGKAFLGKKARTSLKKKGVEHDTVLNDADSNELTLIGPDGEEIDALPEFDPPDHLGYAEEKNLKLYAEAEYSDCDPLQQGLSKVMCDLYCTENAVKEGNTAVITNIKNSHNVLMTNIERLLDYHTKTLMWGMGQLKDQLTKGSANSALLLWGAGDDERRPVAAADGGGGGPAAGLGFVQVQAALEELRALPRLLEANGTVLEAGPRGGASSALTHDVADWHNEASHRMLGRLHDVLEHATNATGGVPGAVHQATALVKRFASERALRLRDPAPERYEVLQSMTTKKAAALRAQIRGRAEGLERISSQSSPLRGAAPEVLLDLADDDVIIRWNQLADHFVAAHEKHAVFAQARARALAAAEDAIHAAESYVGCGGSQLGDLQDSWQHALRVEDHAADVLLEAWASTIAAQERLQMAVDAGLLRRIAEVAAILPAEGGGGGCRGEVALVAEEAHAAGVLAMDRALWPLLEQVVVLEQIAKYQEDEIRAKKLRGVDRVPVTPTLKALHRLASDGADPATPAGRALAARALNRLGPAACPAPDGCGAGMLLFNGTEGVAWTFQQPGLLLLQMEGTNAALAKACAPPGGLCTDPSGLQPESLQQQQQQQQPHEPQPQQRCGPGCEERLRLTLSKKRSTIREVTEMLR